MRKQLQYFSAGQWHNVKGAIDSPKRKAAMAALSALPLESEVSVRPFSRNSDTYRLVQVPDLCESCGQELPS